ncbi:MAG: hypothetical protein KTR31_13745 [Myxococcales bacterium]|nr:hypothetical protein [Myxococcales bacterium]
MLRVRCQQTVTIDAKGRLALPAPIRRALEGLGQRDLVLTFSRGTDGDSVWAWLPEDYEQLEAEVSTQDRFSEEVQDFAHSVLATAQDVELDGQGRVRIPPMLREQAALQRECVVFVVLGQIQIWDKESWARRSERAKERQLLRKGTPGASQ